MQHGRVQIALSKPRAHMHADDGLRQRRWCFKVWGIVSRTITRKGGDKERHIVSAEGFTGLESLEVLNSESRGSQAGLACLQHRPVAPLHDEI